MCSRTTVAVGMSGGVDSSVAAWLLRQKGYQVFGLFMKNWEERDDWGVCRSAYDCEDAQRVCEQIGIPCYTLNFVQEYRSKVFDRFLEAFGQGLTPNPDILCNQEIKFKLFFEKALQLGADFLATGHYCRKEQGAGQGCLMLKGRDFGKDQSYFLYTLNQSVLEKVLFPIGAFEKREVRAIARREGLTTAEKKDSTGICFIGERPFRTFLGQHLALEPGNLERLDGTVVGRHLGAVYYTLGQRKGLGIGGKGEPWFVVGKDVRRGVVLVEQGARHPALYCDDLRAERLSWVAGRSPPTPHVCRAKIRYRQTDQPCTIRKIEGGLAYVEFSTPQRAVTPGQSVVFYDGEVCLGGGVIVERGPSYHALGKPLPPHENSGEEF